MPWRVTVCRASLCPSAQALLNCVRTTLTAIRRRAHSRSSFMLVTLTQPFFRVNVSVSLATGEVSISPQLAVVQVRVDVCVHCLLPCCSSLPCLAARLPGCPSPDGNAPLPARIVFLLRACPHPRPRQGAINEMCRVVLSVLKRVWDWDQLHVPTVAVAGRPPPVKSSFFPAVAKDVEITRSVLLLTGSAYGVATAVKEYVTSLLSFQWLWREDPSAKFQVRGRAAASGGVWGGGRGGVGCVLPALTSPARVENLFLGRLR